MKFDVLRASNDIESKTWGALIEALPSHRRDIHFTASYGRVQEKQGGTAMLAVLSTPMTTNHFVIQPFIKQSIPQDPERFDLCSPYGYGGPIASFDTVVAHDLSARFFAEYLTILSGSENIVSEYCNLHPLFMDHQRRFVNDVTHIVKNIIVIDLNKLSEDTISRRVRRGVVRARNSGAKFVRLNESRADDREVFSALYAESMARKDASSRWRFSQEYLDAHYDQLAARIYHATDDEGGRRALMTIGGYGTAYAHLLGSNGLSLRNGLDEFLYCSAAKALREDGYERFHLGGGLTNDPSDKLLAFKSGFSPDRYKLASYTRIFDEQSYRKLSYEKRADEIKQLGRESTSTRFPRYRRDIE